MIDTEPWIWNCLLCGHVNTAHQFHAMHIDDDVGVICDQCPGRFCPDSPTRPHPPCLGDDEPVSSDSDTNSADT